VTRFTRSGEFEVDVAELFAWHERPGEQLRDVDLELAVESRPPSRRSRRHTAAG